MADNPVIEEHLGRIAAELRLHGRYRDRVMTELQAHLEDAVSAGVADGRSHAEATELAIRELGEPTDLVGRFVPQATISTRATGAVFVAMVALGVFALRVASGLPAADGELTRSVGLTVVWGLGWVWVLLLIVPVVGFMARHRARLGLSGVLGAAALATTAIAGLWLHLSTDTSPNYDGRTDVWQVALMGLAAAGTVGIALLAWTAWNHRLVPRWPLGLAACGIALLVSNHVALVNPLGGLAIAGVAVLIAGTTAGLAMILHRERPLA